MKECAKCGSSDKLDLDFHCATCWRNLEEQVTRLEKMETALYQWMNLLRDPAVTAPILESIRQGHGPEVYFENLQRRVPIGGKFL